MIKRAGCQFDGWLFCVSVVWLFEIKWDMTVQLIFKGIKYLLSCPVRNIAVDIYGDIRGG